MADEDAKDQMGGVEGPEAKYVKLVAMDGHEFIVKREHALTSGTIKAMLSGPGVCVCVCVCVLTELFFFRSVCRERVK